MWMWNPQLSEVPNLQKHALLHERFLKCRSTIPPVKKMSPAIQVKPTRISLKKILNIRISSLIPTHRWKGVVACFAFMI